jgi:hypothetical protein
MASFAIEISFDLPPFLFIYQYIHDNVGQYPSMSGKFLPPPPHTECFRTPMQLTFYLLHIQSTYIDLPISYSHVETIINYIGRIIHHEAIAYRRTVATPKIFVQL